MHSDPRLCREGGTPAPLAHGRCGVIDTHKATMARGVVDMTAKILIETELNDFSIVDLADGIGVFVHRSRKSCRLVLHRHEVDKTDDFVECTGYEGTFEGGVKVVVREKKGGRGIFMRCLSGQMPLV